MAFIVSTNEEEKDCLPYLVDFLVEEFVFLFGAPTMHSDDCVIYNDPNADCPMFITSSTPLRIRLVQASLNYWAQTIFQLSHELCHYAIHVHKSDKRFILSWFEEIVCEAVSLYILSYSAKQWCKCKLSHLNPTFGQSIEEYLNQELLNACTDGFQLCNTYDALKAYEESGLAESDRASHRTERNLLYREISRFPSSLGVVCDYETYLNGDKLTIDFDKWSRMSKSILVPVLKRIQPILD